MLYWFEHKPKDATAYSRGSRGDHDRKLLIRLAERAAKDGNDVRVISDRGHVVFPDFPGFTPQQIHAGLTVPACLPANRQWPVEIAANICPVFQAR